MKNKNSKHKLFSSEVNDMLLPSLHTFDLPTLIEKMKHNPTWVKGELNAMIITKTPEKQIILANLYKNTEFRSVQSNKSITLQIIEGEIEFLTIKESVNLKKGQMLTLVENIEYRIKTIDETLLLFTIDSFVMHLN